MICPHCHKDTDSVPTLKLQTNHMNEYVDPSTGKTDGVYNNNDEKITIKGKELVRKDKFVPKPAPVVNPNPPAPETKK